MKKYTPVVLAIIIGAFSGCATPYQQVGTNVAGGFYSERVAQNRFVVSFVGNGFTAPQKARDFVLLRAAELTLEYHFTYFTIDGQGDLSRVSTVHMGSTSTTTGTISPYGTYSGVTNTTSSDMPVYKPGSRLTITCFDGVPEDKHIGRVYDATAVAADLKVRYNLK